MNYSGDIAKALVLEIMEVIYKYEESILPFTAIGCLEAAKLLMIDTQNQLYERNKKK